MEGKVKCQECYDSGYIEGYAAARGAMRCAGCKHCHEFYEQIQGQGGYGYCQKLKTSEGYERLLVYPDFGCTLFERK